MKRLQVNTLEKAVSTDVNRLQQFAAYDHQEALRLMLDGISTEEAAMGDASLGTNIGTPLRATILNGLLVRPDLATTNTLVDPGVIGMVNPLITDNADDTPFKVVRDAGVPSGIATLQLTANLSGTSRVDIVECQFNQAQVEFDSRDIFNPITGLFLPTSVPKVVQDSLTYRIRQGTPGAGFPGTVNGWLPLMVANVPAGATTWDACTLWDVRPLAADRIHHPFLGTTSAPFLEGRSFAYWSNPAVSDPDRQLAGYIEAAGASGYRLGGHLNEREPFLLFSEMWEPGYTPVAGAIWYMYLAEPFNLPRWARYTDASAGARRPATPRGIPIITHVKLPDGRGRPTAAVAIPLGLGLNGSTTQAKLVLAGVTDGASGNPFRGTCSGRRHDWRLSYALTPTVTKPAQGDVTFNMTLTPNVHFPASATRIRISFDAQWTTPMTLPDIQNIVFDQTMTMADSNGDNYYIEEVQVAGVIGPGSQFTKVQMRFDVPVPQWNNSPITFTLSFVPDPNHATGNVTLTNGPNLRIVGWDLF